jgi:hypothetical protein
VVGGDEQPGPRPGHTRDPGPRHTAPARSSAEPSPRKAGDAAFDPATAFAVVQRREIHHAPRHGTRLAIAGRRQVDWQFTTDDTQYQTPSPLPNSSDATGY